jgi:hypothetical protein
MGKLIIYYWYSALFLVRISLGHFSIAVYDPNQMDLYRKRKIQYILVLPCEREFVIFLKCM